MDNARNMRRILVIVRENVAAIAFIDDFSQFISDSAQVIRGHTWFIRGSLVIERRLCVELSSFTNTYWPCLGPML